MSDPRREASQKSQPPRATHTIRFSDSEWRTVLDLADATGRKPTVLVRRSALGQRLRRRPKARHLAVVQVAAEALAEHDRQLARIGNNLNQLTRLAHVGRVRHGEDFLRVLGRVERELKASRAEIRGALAPFVEAENSHEHRGAPSAEAKAPESAGGRAP